MIRVLTWPFYYGVRLSKIKGKNTMNDPMVIFISHAIAAGLLGNAYYAIL